MVNNWILVILIAVVVPPQDTEWSDLLIVQNNIRESVFNYKKQIINNIKYTIKCSLLHNLIHL